MHTIDENRLDQLNLDLRDWDVTRLDLETKQKELESAQKNSQHYDWLEQATIEYEKMFEKGGIIVKKWLSILGIVSSILGVILAAVGMSLDIFFKQLIPGMIISGIGLLALIIGIVSGILYLRQAQKAQTSQTETEEINRISGTYKQLFGSPLQDIATLKAVKKKIEEDYYKAKNLITDVFNYQEKINRLEKDITNCLSRFGYEGQDYASWKADAETINNHRRTLSDAVGSQSTELAVLSVQSDEYLEADPGIKFSPNEMNNIAMQMTDLNQKIQEEETQLLTLRNEIQSIIGETVPIPWKELIERLRSERINVTLKYKSITSRILASIIVQGVIDSARQQDDENIRTNLASPIVTKPLLKITGRYRTVSMEEDMLKIADQFDEFSMDELSTGAREQVLLALRIGFASKIMGQDAAFMILDDAFQHSDWKRRVNLIEQTMDLAKSGWQILYFSMDDHIRGLFDVYGKKEFGEKYKSFDIARELK